MRERAPGRPSREIDASAARTAAADLLSRRSWTIAELTRRLRRRGAPADVAATVVADIVARGYVDDGAFARQWVETRAARGYGASRLRAELRSRGVAAPLIESALASVSGGDVERARTLARRRLSALARTAPERVATRLRDYLMRRGYPASVAARVVREELTGGPVLDPHGD